MIKPRYIDANAFERKVMSGDEEDVQDVIYSLRDFPAADVREVVHARWVLSGGYWRCSACGTKALLKLDKAKRNEKEYAPQRTDFCPKCCADMRKGQENGQVH